MAKFAIASGQKNGTEAESWGIAMPDFPIVDSHVHLADPNRFGYAWTRNAPSLNRQVLPQHLT